MNKKYEPDTDPVSDGDAAPPAPAPAPPQPSDDPARRQPGEVEPLSEAKPK